MKLFIEPFFRQVDKGDGGIRRVVEAQNQYLPNYGIELVDNIHKADMLAAHAVYTPKIPMPFVSHCHGLYWDEYEWAKWAYVVNKDVVESMRTANAVTAPSHWVANSIRRGTMIDPTVIYHGINIDEWTPGTNEGYVLWNKTRVDAVCDPDPLNQIARYAPNNLFVTTYGTEAPNVKVTGKLPFAEAKPVIANAGVYLATARETFGIGTVEAMACAVPILGWNWGGQAEFIQHKVTGYLVQPGDFQGLLEGLVYCLEHRQEMGDAARQYVIDHFLWPDIVKQYADLYLDVWNNQPPVKVSVVIPAYKLSDLLPRAVNSVLNQDFKDYEIVIVDDNSPDDTLEVANNLAKDNVAIRVVHNEENLYLAGALNEGIKAARGEYIIPLDADNELGAGALRVLAGSLENDPSLDIVFGSMQVVEENGDRYISGWPNGVDYTLQLSHQNQCPSTSMYRKRLWSRIGGYRRRCRTAEDADYWCRALTYGGRAAKVTSAVTLIYYNRGDSMSHVQKDWGWHAWYPWILNGKPPPYAAPVKDLKIPTYEPVIISVVIPVGPGHERYVMDALDSLQAQTFGKFEAIVVNDTGKDLGWIHPWAKVLNTTGKQGPSVARNLGISAAKGALFICLDADDYLQPSALEQMYEVWKLHGGYIFTDWIVPETKQRYFAEEYDCQKLLREFPHAVTALVPVRAWQEVNGFDESFEAWEDWDFFLSLNAAGYCGTRLAEPVLYYRASTGFRRDDMYTRREELKQHVLDKWKDYITGGKQLMACGGCRKGGGQRVVTPSSATPLTNVNTNDVTMLEYIGNNGGARTFTGQATGTKYRFGPDAGHRFKWVWNADVNGLLAYQKEFKRARTGEFMLEASGPPLTTQ